MNRVMGDLALGVRLAVGGSRKAWVRLALQGLGIGMCVAVLILAASLPFALASRDSKGNASEPQSEGSGPAPILVENGYVAYRSDFIQGRHIKVLKSDAPRPPGVDRLPAHGEILLSPALAELLASPEGELLRPRFPQKVVGTIGQPGLTGPGDLLFYAGDDRIEQRPGNMAYGFGVHYGGGGLAPILWLLSVVGIVVLLFPVLVFVGVAARLAAAQRDRRLAALRLVGAGANRVRLIASGEALVGALVGLAVGFGIFYSIRPFVDEISIAQLALFPSDLTPSVGLTLIVVIAVPVLAVVTSLFAMRRTIIEPLGVVRQQKPVRRRLWWRLIPALAGVALLVSQVGRTTAENRPAQWPVVLGVVLLMLGIPVLLPWLVERVVFRIRSGSPALQLAVRRLQLDSGTAARVVGGVAVVLAGTITLQMVLASAEQQVVDRQQKRANKSVLSVTVLDGTKAPGLGEALAKGKGVLAVREMQRLGGQTEAGDYISIAIGSCVALETQLSITNCVDGKAYHAPDNGGGRGIQPGHALTLGDPRDGVRWTAPAVLEETTAVSGGLYLTPAAAAGIGDANVNHEYLATLDLTVPDAAEHARNAIAAYPWQTFTNFMGQSELPEVERVFRLIRQGLYAGSALTLLLAGASMLVMALEQVRERRRPLAVLAASGVPRGTLARSLLWQNGVPLVLSTAVSVATGIGLGALAVRVSNGEVAYDWLGIATVAGAAMALVLVVTALTLPSLRRATGALGLRTE